MLYRLGQALVIIDTARALHASGGFTWRRAYHWAWALETSRVRQ